MILLSLRSEYAEYVYSVQCSAHFMHAFKLNDVVAISGR